MDILKVGKTSNLKLTVRDAFLVVAFHHGNGDWGLTTSHVTKENALQTIAASYREVKSNPSAFPIGLAFIGQNQDGTWGDDFVGVHVENLAEILGRSKEEELKLLDDFVFQVAKGYIAKLTAN